VTTLSTGNRLTRTAVMRAAQRIDASSNSLKPMISVPNRLLSAGRLVVVLQLRPRHEAFGAGLLDSDPRHGIPRIVNRRVPRQY